MELDVAMRHANGQGGDWISCAMCRHASGVGFEGLNERDAEFLTRFKAGRGFVRAGHYVEGLERGLVFTLYSGWALRLREARGGRRMLGIALPGDLIGIETLAGGGGALAVRALTDVTYCRFDTARWHELLAQPSFAERLCRLQAIACREAEERMIAATTLTASGNLCHLILTLFEALSQRRLARDLSFHLPLTRQQLAELLGLTAVHLRRVLHGLADEGVLTFENHRVEIGDPARLRALAGDPAPIARARPLI